MNYNRVTQPPIFLVTSERLYSMAILFSRRQTADNVLIIPSFVCFNDCVGQTAVTARCGGLLARTNGVIV
jgi:hypothetical protein